MEKYIKQLDALGEVYLRIKVNPGANKTEFKNILDDETIKINISAPPEKGKANKELIKYLSKIFKIEKDKINLISGATDRLKLIKIKKLDK